MSEPGGCYAKESKSDQERQVVHGITYICNLKKKVELLETGSGKMVIRGWGWDNRERLVKGTDFQL